MSATKKTVALTGSSGTMGFQGFLELYARKDEFDVFEKAYHIYNALDNLVYALEIGDETIAASSKEYLKQFV